MAKYNWIVPEPAKDFMCIGPKCSYHCCAHWYIDIDKNTYDKYRRLPKSDPLKPRIDSFVQLENKQKRDGLSYAKIVHKDKCPFLTEDNLCKIQLTHGEDYLSLTCRSYPRVEYWINNQLHRGFALSCEEIIRKCVLHKDVIKFIHLESDTAPIMPLIHKDLNEKEYASTPSRHYFMLREFIIAILQFRSYRIWERLTFLGMFMKALDSCSPDDVPALINKYIAMLGNDAVRKQINTIAYVPKLQIAFTNTMFVFKDSSIFDSRLRNRFTSAYDIFSELQKGQTDYDWYVKIMEDASSTLEEHEYIFENFLVMCVFNYNELILTEGKSYIESFGKLTLYYAMLRFFFVIQNMQSSLSKDDIVNVCVDVARIFDINQSSVLKKNTLDMLKSDNLDTLGCYISLIK